jgi:hypothetical protein
MRKPLVALTAIATIIAISNLLVCVSLAQSPTTENPPVSALVILEDTPVRLKLLQTLSSGTSKVNDKVDFEVIEEVKVKNVIVIPQGGTAIATVTEAQPKRRFGRAGKLNVNIDYVRLVNGDKATLRAVKGGKGGTRTAAMTTAVVATAIVFFPAAPLFFFMKGKNIIIPKGTEITAFIAADKPVSLTETQTVNGQPTIEATGDSTIVVTSTPTGAEITIDEKFMGTTRSTVKQPPGEHIVRIAKTGYKDWTRTVTLNAGGQVTIDATLEKNPD